MLGTRFVATIECLAHPVYKREVIAAHARDTALTMCFQDGWPALYRALRNRMMPQMRSRWIPGPSPTRNLSAEATWLPKPTCYEKTTETVRWKVSSWRRCHLSKGASYPQILRTRLIFRPEFVAHGDGTPRGGKQPMQKLLLLRDRPTAVFCYNDMTALGALAAIEGRGIEAPRQISVSGFDDLFFSSYLRPPLTTIRQPMRKIGAQAMTLLLQLLAGQPVGRIVTVKGQLIVRSSTASPPA